MLAEIIKWIVICATVGAAVVGVMAVIMLEVSVTLDSVGADELDGVETNPNQGDRPMSETMNDSDLLVYCGQNAGRWAEMFCQTAKRLGHDIDEGWMLGWFSNAIVTATDLRLAAAIKERDEQIVAWHDRMAAKLDEVDTTDAVVMRILHSVIGEHRDAAFAIRSGTITKEDE